MERFELRRDDFEKRGATIAGICVDPADVSQALVKKLGLGFPILSDPGGETILAYGVEHAGKKIALPSIFVIAPDGRIAWRRVSANVLDRPAEDEVLAVVGKVH